MVELCRIVALLSLSDGQFTRALWRLRHLKAWLLALVVIIYAGFLVGNIIWLFRVWRGDDWLNYWLPFVFTAQFSISAARLSSWRNDRAHLYAPVAELRDAVHAGDETRAPRKEIPSGDDANIFGVTRVGPLQRPKNNAAVILLCLVAVPVLLAMIDVFVVAGGYGFVATILSIAVLAPTIVVALWCVWALRQFSITVNDTGMRWRRLSGRRVSLRWSQARAFYCVYGRPRGLADLETFYALDFGSSVLTWREIDSTSLTAEQKASQRLARIITRRTGLLLRDLSSEAKRLESLLPEDVEEAESLAVKTGLLLSRAQQRRRVNILFRALAPVLALAAISGGLEIGQPWYFAALYQQAHAHHTLYTNKLAYADDDWPVSARISFADGALVATDDSFKDVSPLFAPAPHIADNALYEVTACTGNAISGAEYEFGGPGLAILGSGNGRNMLVFYINFDFYVDGSWQLDRISSVDRYSDIPNEGSGIRSAHDSDIQSGVGAVNRLAVLVRSGDFTFFINGHYAARYHDDSFAGGRVGLTLGGQEETASFTDLAIYLA